MDTIIGLPLRAMCFNSGAWVISYDATLNAGTHGSSRSADSSSNGEDRNASPRRRQCPASFGTQSSGVSMSWMMS